MRFVRVDDGHLVDACEVSALVEAPRNPCRTLVYLRGNSQLLDVDGTLEAVRLLIFGTAAELMAAGLDPARGGWQ